MEIPCVRAVLCARDAMQACKDKVCGKGTSRLASVLRLYYFLEELYAITSIAVALLVGFWAPSLCNLIKGKNLG